MNRARRRIPEGSVQASSWSKAGNHLGKARSIAASEVVRQQLKAEWIGPDRGAVERYALTRDANKLMATQELPKPSEGNAQFAQSYVGFLLGLQNVGKVAHQDGLGAVRQDALENA